MLSVAAYYLMSPLNLIFYFFDAEHIYIGTLIVTLLKTGLIGLAMYQFLSGKHDDAAAIIFSTAYALSAYTVGYSFNIFWMDSLILLPYIVKAIESLIDEGNFLFYTILTALVIIVNFYTGYIVCLFSVLYFLYYFFSVPRRKNIFWTFLLYGTSSLLGGMLSMWLILPVSFTLLRGKSTFSFTELLDFHKLFNSAELIDAMFCGTIGNTPITSGKPLIYCGIFPLILAIYQIVCGRDSKRKKVLYLILFTCIICSFNHYNLNCVWHALNYPTGSPHRFAFLYIFLLLYIAYKGFINLREQPKSKSTFVTVISTGIILLSVLLCRKASFITNFGRFLLILNICLIITYTVILLVIRHKHSMYFFVVFSLLELFLNAETLYCKSEQYDSVKITEYQNYMASVHPLVKQIPKSDLPYRTVMTKGAYRTPNDSFLFNLYGLDSYTSVEEKRISQIAYNFGYGFADNIFWGIHYLNGASNAADTLLGVKYMVSSDYPKPGYFEINCEDKLKLYENKNALPFAVLADQSILDLQSTDLPSFLYINKLYHSLNGQLNDDIFQELPKQLSAAYHCAEQQDGSIHATDTNTDAYVEYEYTTAADCTVYVSYNNAGISYAEAFIGNEKPDLEKQINNVKSLGDLKKGTKIIIRYYLEESSPLFPQKIYVYGESQELLEEYVTYIKNQAPAVTMHIDSSINISYTNESNEQKYILCSIPWERGWHVYQNGTKSETPLSIQRLIVIPVEPGKHEIELRYVPQGFIIGIGLTIFGAIILLVLDCFPLKSTFHSSMIR